jgi:hypothetical protein
MKSYPVLNYAPGHEDVWGSGSRVPRILNLGTRLSCQLHDPSALPPAYEPWYPLDRRLDGPQRRSGSGGEEKSPITAPAGN